MSDDNLEVLDANIVILPEEPLTPIVNALSLFVNGKLASFIRKPLTPSQGLNIDPETMVALANALHIEHVKAIGANWQVIIKLPEGTIASAEIAKKLLQQNTSFLPQNLGLVGGAARLFLSDPSGVEYTLAIEPGAQNPQTDELWMTCNANRTSPEALTIDLLKEMFQQSYHLLFEVKESFFPDPQL